jgi:branched-chain amino acid transport system ATP-binding protein
MALLAIENLTVSFEGLRALEGVSFSVEQGDLFSLVGPNGAGKTTVFNCISRICRQNLGEIRFNGEEISKKKPHEIPRLGIARTFQNLELFHGMSALGNILLGCHIEARTRLLDALLFTRRLRRAETSARKAAEEVIDFLELEAVRRKPVSDLPYGIQKRIELGRALALKPKLLLLDEPAAGLNNEEKEELAFWVEEIRSGLGITVLLVEHDMQFVMDLSDRICVLDHGRVIAEGLPDEVAGDSKVVEAYLGENNHHEARSG